MLLQFAFLSFSKYGLPIRQALSRFESEISKFDAAQISFTFLSTSQEISLSTDGTPSILVDCTALFLHKEPQWLYSVFYIDKVGEAYLLVCHWVY